MEDDTNAESVWVSFFVKAGFPMTEASTYGSMFAKNRITNMFLSCMNMGVLEEIGMEDPNHASMILKIIKVRREKNRKRKRSGSN